MANLVEMLLGGATVSLTSGLTPRPGLLRVAQGELIRAIAALPATRRRTVEAELAKLGESEQYDIG